LLAQLSSTVGTAVKALRPIFVSTEGNIGKQSGGYADVEIAGARNLTHFRAFSVRYWFGARSGGS